MELHKANLEAAQPMLTNPALSMNQFIPNLNPFLMGNIHSMANQQLPMNALLQSQQAQLINHQQQQIATTPVSSTVAMQTQVAQNMLQQATTQHQQQLMNGNCMNKTSLMNSSATNNSCYTFANGNGGTPNTVMSVNNLAAALPIAYFFSKPPVYAPGVAPVVSQSGLTSSNGCTNTSTTVSSAGQVMHMPNNAHHHAAMLSLHSLTAAHHNSTSTSTSPSSLTNSYHVTPKLKAPSGLITLSSRRRTDKFSPY